MSASIAAGRRVSLVDSAQSSSTINLCPARSTMRNQSVDSTGGLGMYSARQEATQAAPSYGGIMVFQEITVDVQEGTGTAERKPSNGSDTDALIVEKTVSRPQPAANIEMQSMGHFGTNDIGTQLSNDIEAGKGGHSQVTCFVDVLFAKTVESR
jgi:hypothetical protein